MKILQIIYSLSSGGAERFVVDLSNSLTEKGHKVYLCTLRDDTIDKNGFYKNEISDKVEYINLKLKKRVRLSNIYHLWELIKGINPDVVHCHQNLVNYIFPLSIVFSKIKFFHTIHNDAPKEVSNRLEFWIRRYFYQSKKMRVITISNETSKSFALYYKLNTFTEIYNGRKAPSPSQEFEITKRIVDNLRMTSQLIFLHVGRFAQQKNQELLIRVFNRLITDRKSVTLLIIGDGFDSLLGEKLKSIACERIIFLGQKHNMADYYLNADAFCLSSTHEGMPITLLEALACGCTPICTPVGGIMDAIEPGITGFLSQSTSEEDYYQTIITNFTKINEIKKEKLIDCFNKYYSIEKCSQNHIQLYNQ